MRTTSSSSATPDAAGSARARARPTGSGSGPTGWTADAGLLVLRLTLAVSFIGHGAQKFGAFGGAGVEGFAAGTLSGYGFRFPVAMAYLNGLTELVGGVLVAVGLLTPLAATGLMAVMIDSTLLKFGNGFFFTNPGGYEIDVALGGLATGVILLGAGRLALDAALETRMPLLGRKIVRPLLLVIGVLAALAVYFLLR